MLGPPVAPVAGWSVITPGDFGGEWEFEGDEARREEGKLRGRRSAASMKKVYPGSSQHRISYDYDLSAQLLESRGQANDVLDVSRSVLGRQPGRQERQLDGGLDCLGARSGLVVWSVNLDGWVTMGSGPEDDWIWLIRCLVVGATGGMN